MSEHPRVLITGGTGFIGSRLSLQLSRLGYRVTVLSRTGKLSSDFLIENNADRMGVGRKPGDSAAEQRPDHSTARRLLEDVEVVAGDVRNASFLARLVEKSDIVIHNAALLNTAHDRQQILEINAGGTANLATALTSRKHNVKAVVLSSSISVYGEGNYLCRTCGIVRPLQRFRVPQPIGDEDAFWNPPCPDCNGAVEPAPTPENATLNGESTYATSKIIQEHLLATACQTAEIPLTILRYATVYGATHRHCSPYERFLRLLIDGKPPVVFEDGKQSRDFVFIDDVVAANINVLQHAAGGLRIFNVGSNCQTTIWDFACQLSQWFAHVLGKELVKPVIEPKLLPGDVRHCHTDCSAIKTEIDLTAQVSLIDGIHKLVSWYKTSMINL